MKAKAVFYSTECGNETPKWQGKCNACGSWNTIVEKPKDRASVSSSKVGTGRISSVKKLNDCESGDEVRFSTGMSELDRVLGGGAVKGSLILVGGAPGIGKSTLLLQICQFLCKKERV